ncbi:MAG: DNA polymerase III subunit delta [Bacteroidales bacterium]|nr:DNA polymerase III subunit delta [Bacteroidales bacterium]MBK9358008.1 DNA polymerase III subunit delta [Bacteroidales bacterium]
MKFRDITGQELIKERLRRSVRDNRVSHAQLFLGPEGSGKLALALAYAQYINCTQRSVDDSCGTCSSCLKYEKIIHPDLHFIYPVAKTKEVEDKPLSKLFLTHWRNMLTEKKAVFGLQDWYQQIGLENKQGIINAEDCNEIIRTLSYKSYESEYKVMIIWMVEKLFHAAAPKILKILEEPPDKTLFILISEQAEMVLPTILSRTQLVKFSRLSDQHLVEALMTLTSCTGGEANQVKYLADGNLNAARKILETGETDQANFEFFRLWMRQCFRNDIREISRMTSDFSALGREKQKSLMAYALKIIRFCLHNRIGNHQQIRTEGDELKFIRDFTPFIHPLNANRLNDEFNKAFYHIERNGNATIIFMDLSLQSMKWLKIKPKTV